MGYQLDCNPSQAKSNLRLVVSVRLQPKPSQVKPKTGCNQLDCNPSQVKSNLRLVVSLLLHCLFIFFFLSSSFFFLYIYNWTTSNAYISVNSQPIWAKFWILHLMTNPNKVYDTTPNLNHSKSQLISTTSNA